MGVTKAWGRAGLTCALSSGFAAYLSQCVSRPLACADRGLTAAQDSGLQAGGRFRAGRAPSIRVPGALWQPRAHKASWEGSGAGCRPSPPPGRRPALPPLLPAIAPGASVDLTSGSSAFRAPLLPRCPHTAQTLSPGGVLALSSKPELTGPARQGVTQASPGTPRTCSLHRTRSPPPALTPRPEYVCQPRAVCPSSHRCAPQGQGTGLD